MQVNGGLNLNLGELGGLENLPSGNEEDKIEKFSWDREFEEIGGEKVKKYEILEHKDDFSCLARVEILEGDFFELNCSVYGGIKVIGSSNEEFEGKVYESLEGLLMRASPMYIQGFNDGIVEGLKGG